MKAIYQHISTWWKSEFKQPFRSTNDEKQKLRPVVFFGVLQSLPEAHQIRDEWTGQKGFNVRVYERQIRVDTIITSAFIVVVRRVKPFVVGDPEPFRKRAGE